MTHGDKCGKTHDDGDTHETHTHMSPRTDHHNTLTGTMRHLPLHDLKPLTGVQNIFNFLNVTLHHPYHTDIPLTRPEDAMELPGQTHLGTTSRQWHWDSPLVTEQKTR